MSIHTRENGIDKIRKVLLQSGVDQLNALHNCYMLVHEVLALLSRLAGAARRRSREGTTTEELERSKSKTCWASVSCLPAKDATFEWMVGHWFWRYKVMFLPQICYVRVKLLAKNRKMLQTQTGFRLTAFCFTLPEQVGTLSWSCSSWPSSMATYCLCYSITRYKCFVFLWAHPLYFSASRTGTPKHELLSKGLSAHAA